MTARITCATALRVLTQLRRHPWTMVMLLAGPPLLLTLVRYMFEHQRSSFQTIGGPLVGLLPFIAMFLASSITMLRERTGGTLERLMTMPLAKLDVIVGYGVAFAAIATIQALVTAGVGFGLLGVHVAGSTSLAIALAVANAILGMALGLFISATARRDVRVVQFLPAVVLVQLLLCGLFVARGHMAKLLQGIADVLPLTYAFDSLQRTTVRGTFGGRGALDIAVITGSTLLAVALGAATLPRRAP
jgi:ABC-2 type transport system permease protein